ncbi:hypothetical protein HDC34_000228 [Pseudoclavibacter sp. JAI123]|jgi:hypothetical protein|nr:hypothetical protein [Pseudoclavibacter sp. JAI123]
MFLRIVTFVLGLVVKRRSAKKKQQQQQDPGAQR